MVFRASALQFFRLFSKVVFGNRPMNDSTILPVLDHYFAPEAQTLYGLEIERGQQEFFGPKHDEDITEAQFGKFSEWFIFAHILANSKTPLVHFHDENPKHLENGHLSIYKHLQKHRYGIFAVRGVPDRDTLELFDLDTELSYTAREPGLSEDIGAGDLVIGRVVSFGDHYEMAGGSTIIVPKGAGLGPSLLRDLPAPLHPRNVMYYFEALASEMSQEEKNDGKTKTFIHERPPIKSLTDLDLAHAGIKITKLPNNLLDLCGSNDGPSEENDDGCPVCLVYRKAKASGERAPNPEALRQALEDMARGDY